MHRCGLARRVVGRSGTVATLAVIGSAVVACGGTSSSGFRGGESGGGNENGEAGAVGNGTAASPAAPDGGGSLFGDGGFAATDAAPSQGGPGATPQGYLYAHSDSTLYRIDPNTNAVTVVGTFSGCSGVIDIAIDASSNAYVTTSLGFYRVDLQTAACTLVGTGLYPNSLSFVPKGTLDANVEALVGYFGSEYVRIDPASGSVTTVGGLSAGYDSSGDIVSVIGGGTFLTVNGNGCGDCLLQIDPKTGDMIQSYGSVSHANVFGLAFWAGTAYGFDDAGQMFTLGWQGNALVTTDIPVANAPPQLSFWGAGSTTAAPPTSADGGGIPVLQ